MAILNPTPSDRLVDDRGRPYFLWDSEMTLDEVRAKLETGSRQLRGYLVGKLMRQAKPDDVFQFVTRAEIADLWLEIGRHLGRTRDFWTWILAAWEEE